MKLLSDYNYTGPSMKPLFRPGDGIIVDAEVSFDKLKVGDVICFDKPDQSGITVVHRIVRITPDGVITRGDNNSDYDPYIVTAAMRPQLVKWLKRGSKTYPVANGWRGICLHRYHLLRRRILLLSLPLLRRLYLMLVELELLSRFKILNDKLTLAGFKGARGRVEFIMLNHRSIGHRRPDGTWHISFPWRFLIDPERLPAAFNSQVE